MEHGLTDIASQLATHMPTGAKTQEDAVQDWRTTLYNAARNASLAPLTDMIRREVPADTADEICETLKNR